MTPLPRLTLSRAFLGYVAAFCAIVSVVCLGFVQLRGDRFTDSTLDSAVRIRTDAAAAELARSLEQDWRNLVYLADQVGLMNAEDLGGVINGASGDRSRISWMGFADLSGAVRASTDGLLLGADVSERPWYRAGLNGGFAGDVHDALLLAKLLGSEGDEPLRFIDLSQPVLDRNGSAIGVLGVHINLTWLKEQLVQSAEVLGIDLYLISPDGTIAASSSQELPSPAELQILRQAQAGVEGKGREVWPDGKAYFSSLVPQVTHGELPNFGWRMVGRLDATSIHLGIDLLKNGAHYALLLALVLIAAATFLFVVIVVKPFEQLANSAADIADGGQDYPANSRITREAAQLSSALARLQQDRSNGDR